MAPVNVEIIFISVVSCSLRIKGYAFVLSTFLTALAMRLVALVLCSALHFQGLKGSPPDDPELIERSLATTNLLGFSEELLFDALFPNEVEHLHSAEELMKALSSAEGQEAARAAAMRSMLTNSRARGTGGWLGGMCDAMPWLSWLMRCAGSDEQMGLENREDPAPEPSTLVIEKYVYARCDPGDGDYDDSNSKAVEP